MDKCRAQEPGVFEVIIVLLLNLCREVEFGCRCWDELVRRYGI